MTDAQYPDVKSLTPLETQHITPTCRANRTDFGAWVAACRELWQVYDAQVATRPGATVSLALYITDNPALPEIPAEDVRFEVHSDGADGRGSEVRAVHLPSGLGVTVTATDRGPLHCKGQALLSLRRLLAEATGSGGGA